MSTTKSEILLAKEIFGFIIRMKEVEKIEKLQKQDIVQRYILDRNTKQQINAALDILVENGNITIEVNGDIILLDEKDNIREEIDILPSEETIIKSVASIYGFKESLISIVSINKENIEFTVCKVRYKANFAKTGKLIGLKITEQE